jgi:hypothetical protein
MKIEKHTMFVNEVRFGQLCLNLRLKSSGKSLSIISSLRFTVYNLYLNITIQITILPLNRTAGVFAHSTPPVATQKMFGSGQRAGLSRLAWSTWPLIRTILKQNLYSYRRPHGDKMWLVLPISMCKLGFMNPIWCPTSEVMNPVWGFI